MRDMVGGRNHGLSAPLWNLIERALRTGEGREVAIRTIQDHLYQGGARDPALLIALARLTYVDAATLMVSRLRDASERSLQLVDEALAEGGDPDGSLAAMRATLLRAVESERRREGRLRALLVNPNRASATDLMQLAHQIMLSGEDDELAAQLMTLADERDREEGQPTN